MPVESCTQSLCDLSLAFGDNEEEGGMVGHLEMGVTNVLTMLSGKLAGKACRNTVRALRETGRMPLATQHFRSLLALNMLALMPSSMDAVAHTSAR